MFTGRSVSVEKVKARVGGLMSGNLIKGLREGGGRGRDGDWGVM